MSTRAVAVNRSKVKFITLWILRSLAALAFLGAGGAKLAGAPPMVAMFARLGLGQWFRYATPPLLITSRAEAYGNRARGQCVELTGSSNTRLPSQRTISWVWSTCNSIHQVKVDSKV